MFNFKFLTFIDKCHFKLTLLYKINNDDNRPR